jgi:hypothetical protein
VLVSLNSFYSGQRGQLVALASRHAVPAMYGWREFPSAGGLISYGIDNIAAFRQAGVYAGPPSTIQVTRVTGPPPHRPLTHSGSERRLAADPVNLRAPLVTARLFLSAMHEQRPRPKEHPRLL